MYTPVDILQNCVYIVKIWHQSINFVLYLHHWKTAANILWISDYTPHQSPSLINSKKRTPDHAGHRHTYLASDSSSLTRLCASSSILSVAVFCSESFSFLLSILFSVWRRIYFSLSAGGRDNNSKSSSPAGQNNIGKWWYQNDAKIDWNLPKCFFIRSIDKRVLDNSFQVSLLRKDLKVSIKSG